MNTYDSHNYLHVSTDLVIEGQNTQEVHATFIDVTEFVREDVFKVGNTTYRGSWVADGGDLAAPENTRERRLLCNLGRAAITFTGTSIAVRTSLNPGWGQAKVLINGVKPSTIAGLTIAKDSVSCDAEALNSWGNEYVDQVVADNLPPGEHTLELLCTTNGATQFFVFSGVKVYDFAKKSAAAEKWAVAMADREQPIGITFKLTDSKRIRNASATFGPLALGADKLPLGTVSLNNLLADAPVTVSALPKFTGAETSGALSLPITLNYQMQDPSGSIIVIGEVKYNHADPLFTYTGAWWIDPPASDGYPEETRGSGARAAWVRFKVKGDAFTIRVGVDYGTSPGVVFKDVVERANINITSGQKTLTVPLADQAGIAVGSRVIHTRFANGTTVTAISGTTVAVSNNATGTTNKAAIAFGTYVTDIVTDERDETKQRQMVDKTVAGLGANYNGDILIQCGSTAGFAFNTVTLQNGINYSEMTDNVSIDFAMKQVPPAPITEVQLAQGAIAYTLPDGQAHDLQGVQPFDNRPINSVEVEYRFPSFICCYTSGYLDLFKEYDIVITDPGSYTYNDIQELRALGIKVYLYVSFGEEDGQLANRWDATSGKGPWRGNGSGPGGYAGYYLKGGFEYGEYAECTNDRQRMEGVKACSKNNSKYFTGTGRCSKACGHDWRTGYSQWQEGGACGGGYTSANNWQRDASNACSNTACTKYIPIHEKCPQYEQASGVWGQDFSIMDQAAPDENGIWSSYYVNAVARGPGSWFERLQQYYLPLVFGEPVAKEETVTMAARALTDGSTVFGVEVVGAPIDEGFPVIVADATTGYVYAVNTMYAFDKMEGTFIFAPADAEAPAGYVAPYAGQQVKVSYTKRGLNADGVFMDTVDTVDVYPSEAYQQGFADLINELKLLWPDRGFCSNRGFSIYDKMIHSCDLVMTESVFSDYDFNEGTYQEVDGASAAWNGEVTRMIQELRKKHTFDVVCLNYAPNGPEGDAIRASVQQKTLALGWMPWLSTILLNDPLRNNRYQLTKGYIRSNEWRRIRATNVGD